MSKNSNAILTSIVSNINSSFNLSGYNKYISSFMEARSTQLYDTSPCDRLFFTDKDYIDFFSMTHIDEGKVKSGLHNTYFWGISAFNPRAAKDPLTIAQLCIVRNFLIKNKEKEAELAGVFLSFSGKFYPSIHYASYPKTPPSQYRHVMEWVVNNQLNERFDLKAEGSVIGAIRKIVITWIKTYISKFKSFKDEDCVYLIQQLHSRIKSFTINIAKLYYEAYENKDTYMSYSQDMISQDADNNTSTILSDNDSLLAERIVQKTMEYINIRGVDYKTCMEASDYNVRVNEIKSIMETIINNPNEQVTIREFLSILITTYFQIDPKKDINDIKFISYSIAAKPNAKNPYIVRGHEIVETWLNEKSPAYRKRNKRPETKASYFRSIYAYFTLTIYYANK